MAYIPRILYMKMLLLSLVTLASSCCSPAGPVLTCRNCDFTKGSFKGMHSLHSVELHMENIIGPLPSGIFQPFKNLTNLMMSYTYPNDMANNTMDIIPNLQHLTMQMKYNAVLGKEFYSMRNLKYLQILTFCNGSITKKTFAAIPNLETLHIAGGLVHIEPDALVNFHNLSTLALTCNNKMSIKQVTDAIKHQRRATLEKLILDGSEGDGLVVLSGDLFNSPNFDKITHLSLRKTFIVEIDVNILDGLPKLQYLSIGFNSILKPANMGDKDVTLTIYKALQHLNRMKIQTLDLSYMYNQVGSHFRDRFCNGFASVDQFFRKPPLFVAELTQNETFNRTVVKVDGIIETKVRANLPPSLQYLYFDNMGYLHKTMPHVFPENKYNFFNDDNNIVFINASNTKLRHLHISKGLNKLQGIDASFCRLIDLHPRQLYYLPSLRYLNLSHNYLASIDLTESPSGGSMLQWLDLSYNDLKHIPKYCLSNLTSAEYVSFKGNPILNIDINLENNTRLKTLDLSSGAMQKIGKDMIHQLESLQAKLNHTLHLDLTGNKFQCMCETIDMIQWFSTTKIDLHNKEDIKCIYKDITIHLHEVDVQKLQQDCSKHALSLILATVPVTIAALAVLSVITLVYQSRWKLRWHLYRLKRHLRHKLHPNGYEFILQPLPKRFNAFVSYNNTTDYEWVANTLIPMVEDNWGLELCIAQRDFEPGVPIAENICEAVDKSYRTILVITPGFVKSIWCEFEMQMELTRGLQNLIIIYKEEVPTTDMSKTLVFLMKSLNYIEYNEDPNGLQMFWNKLHKSLTSST